MIFSEHPGRATSKAQALKEQKTRESEAMESYFKTQVAKAEVEVKTLKLDYNIKALQFAKMKADLERKNIPIPKNLFNLEMEAEEDANESDHHGRSQSCFDQSLAYLDSF